MRSDLRKARLLMGRAIIKSYKEDWLPNKKQIDRIIEDMVLSGKWLDETRVQGGDRVPAAEKLLQIKENNREYLGLVRKIERMAKILEGMSDEQLAIMESYHWKGVPWYECAKRLNKSQTAFFKAVYRIEETAGAKWEGEEPSEED
jgi:hypothetical protein